MVRLDPIAIEEVTAARERLSGAVLRTPLVRLSGENLPAEIYLKLENLQPVGSFKVRGAANVLKKAAKDQLSRGITTASSGNLGLAVAWYARQIGIPCTAIVPETSADAKLIPLQEAGGKVIKVPYGEWFEIVSSDQSPESEGYFVHPVFNPDMMSGHGTMALEILEDLPDVDAVIMPYGGGGLFCGVSSAMRALKPDTKLFVSEVETAAPVAAALAAGEPKEIIKRPAPFHCVGAPRVLAPMWPLVSRFLDGSIVVTIEEVAEALRRLAGKHHIIVEGSGALPVAAAETGRAGPGKVVCVVTGGNIDLETFVKILGREIPQKE
ncbi:MAG: pyridoxal-phosphate dependent enzyme [Candidatus Aminicenantes bacterium]|nr:pyridoxal-phosphate dependent enzyme [Candidatus Aminicenantes bacterium]MBM3311888.1 pyridoxal-phosphate dependent enzyme [Candidatus Aminicenantes bacterium]